MTSHIPPAPFTLEFYDDPTTGTYPVLEWMRELDRYRRQAIGAALREVLQRQGKDVAETEWGRNLGQGLFEFRVRHDAEEIIKRFGGKPRPEPDRQDLVLRVFFYPHGNRLILLLSGYDKGDDPSERRQDREIDQARKYLREFRSRP